MKDLIIVGSGPAGSTSAYTAAKKGLDVLLLDKQKFPRDKACGGALGFKALEVIPEKDILLPTSNKVAGLHIVSPSLKYEARCENGNIAYLTSRKDFDNNLREKAIEAGADFRQENVKQANYGSECVEVTTETSIHKGKILVIANGVNSKLPRLFGFKRMYNQTSTALTMNSETPMANDLLDKYFSEKRFVSLFFGPVSRGYGWVFPKNGLLNIGIGCTRKYLTHARKAYEKFVTTVKDYFNLIDFKPEKPRGHLIPFSAPRKKTYADRVMIVGDAAWMVSALSGEGICYGLLSGKLAAETAVTALSNADTSAKSLKEYQRRWVADFGQDLSKYAKKLHELVYKSNKRMEFLVKLASKDSKLMSIFTDSISGIIDYKTTWKNLVKRLPSSLLKRREK